MIRIQIIYAKTCPICKKILENILLPLALKFPDIIFLDVKEAYSSRMIPSVLVPGGKYHPVFGRVPEIVIGDKRYLVSKDKTALLKLLKDLHNMLVKEIEKKPMYIRDMYYKTISRIYENIRKME